MYQGGSKDDSYRRVDNFEGRKGLRVQSVMLRPGDMDRFNESLRGSFERSMSSELNQVEIKTVKLRIEYKGHSLPIDPKVNATVCRAHVFVFKLLIRC